MILFVDSGVLGILANPNKINKVSSIIISLSLLPLRTSASSKVFLQFGKLATQTK